MSDKCLIRSRVWEQPGASVCTALANDEIYIISTGCLHCNWLNAPFSRQCVFQCSAVCELQVFGRWFWVKRPCFASYVGVF